jgi:hypothetical protein
MRKSPFFLLMGFNPCAVWKTESSPIPQVTLHLEQQKQAQDQPQQFLNFPHSGAYTQVFHINLLTPYKETAMHGANYQHPPPDLVDSEEEYTVEKILDSLWFGRDGNFSIWSNAKDTQTQDNMWVDKDDIFAKPCVQSTFMESKSCLLSSSFISPSTS